ncbi:MAG: di-heme oxidoredictase family protein [Gemmatimonadales bacterium]
MRAEPTSGGRSPVAAARPACSWNRCPRARPGAASPRHRSWLRLARRDSERAARALADPEDRDGDGISGRLGADAAGALARFGRKADVATLAEFVASAAHLEMGLTSSAHPDDLAQGRPVDGSIDGVAGPELDASALALLTDYVRFLAPTGRGPAPAGWNDAQVAAGERIFSAIGCAACHVPSLVTGSAAPPPLREREVAFYSDFLLHDMGPALADLCTPGAGSRELRTEPLMGLRLRDLLLHDGRTTDLRRAIELHDGEARAARDAFGGLGAGDREALLAFLRTL